MRQTNSRHTKTKGLLALIFAASAVLLAVAGFHNAGAAFVQDCKANSIIVCGSPTADDFITKVRADSDGHGNHDLQAVYGDFGLVPSDYSRFVTAARPGMAMQNGTIVVDGQTVATNAWSIGRTQFSYTTPITISGHTYFKANDTQVLLQNLPVMVMFNAQGQMQFAVMNACGNPVKAENVAPKFSCDLLQSQAVSGQQNTFTFTTKATATNNAKLVNVVYAFGDGTTATVTDLNTPVQHTFIANTCGNSGNTCTVMATVSVSLPGNQMQTVTSATCKTQISVNVPPPPPVSTPQAPQAPTPTPTPPPAMTTSVTTPPPTLPSTGASGIIGLFTVASIGGYFGYRAMIRRRISRILK
jgi:hypothetical protein